MLALNLTENSININYMKLHKPRRVDIILRSSIIDERKIILLHKIAKNWHKNTNAHHIICAYTNTYEDFIKINNYIFSKKLAMKMRDEGLSSYIIIRRSNNKIMEIK